MDKKKLNFGVIGSGFMGKTHVFGVSLANRVFDLRYNLHIAKIADVSESLAGQAASELGIDKYTGDWRDLITDENIHIINITSPNSLHKEMAARVLSTNKEKWNTIPRTYSEIDTLRNKFKDDNEKIKKINEINSYIEEMEKMYQNAS